MRLSNLNPSTTFSVDATLRLTMEGSRSLQKVLNSIENFKIAKKIVFAEYNSIQKFVFEIPRLARPVVHDRQRRQK